MRYLLLVLLYIPVQLLAYMITPILPAFAVRRMGWSDNHSCQSVELRLPLWLSWFDTPDNSLGRDGNFMASHKDNYLSRVIGLYRNSLYGFKWSVLTMPIDLDQTVTGNHEIDYHTKTFGTMVITQRNGAWQYKSVKPFLGKIIVLNFGWLLDDKSQERALFMFSPRIKSSL